MSDMSPRTTDVNISDNLRAKKATAISRGFHCFASRKYAIKIFFTLKILVNPRYEHLRPFVERLVRPDFFADRGATLHSGRNTVKLFETDGMKLVVKSYDRLSAFNRLAYGTLRKSKAMRAYLHADRLRRLGIDTPEAVAVAETRKGGLMRQSYFVSLYSDYESIVSAAEPFMQNTEAKNVLDGVAAFLLRMHGAGVEHKDLNAGNILYKKDGDGGYLFQVIDTNRMSFHRRMSMHLRLRNMRRLGCSAPAYLYMLHRYAELSRTDVGSTQLKGAVDRLVFEWRQRTKAKLKNILPSLRRIFGSAPNTPPRQNRK
mgnify:CR=1 FL=1